MLLPGGIKHNYRSDIDGLRAIACLAVVIFHAFPKSLRGGFVGVDIFFVISGFLISSIIYRNLFNSENPGKVNIVDFYIRRVRRIFPALIAVLITTLMLGWFVLLPDEYKLLGKHVFGGSVYINNFMLFNESGDYFNAASNAKPLLHLWSLGVEEQFYLIFPVFLYLLYKTKLNFVLSLTFFTVVSFCLNEYNISTNHQTSAFYLPWCRFWELSVGAILAYIVSYNHDSVAKLKDFLISRTITIIFSKIIFKNSTVENRQKLINNLISLAGIMVIIAGIAFVKNDTRFPGSRTLIPVLGALMIIAAGKTAVINRYVLSNPAMVFLGLISYPLYLWHWPLLSLAYICDGQQPATWIRICAVLIAILLSVLTYFFIEPPLRYGKYPKIKTVSLFMFLLFIGSVGAFVYLKNGFITRFGGNQFPYELRTYLIWDKDKVSHSFTDFTGNKYYPVIKQLWGKVDNCLQHFPDWDSYDHRCYMESDNLRNKVSFAMFGDSFSANLLVGLQKMSYKEHIYFDSYQWSMTIPLYGFMSQTHRENGWIWIKGSDLMMRAYDYALKNPKTHLFVLAHNPAASYFDMTDKLDPSNNSLSPKEKYLVGMKRTVELLLKHNKKVLFVLPNPALPFEPNECMNRPFQFTRKGCSFDRKIHDNNFVFQIYNDAVKEIAARYPNVSYLDLADFICNKEKCFPQRKGDILYADTGHTNLIGSEFEGKFVFEKIIKILNSDTE